MTDGYDDDKMNECAADIKIVLAGTIASGKTTLLAAIPYYNFYGEKGTVTVEPYTPLELKREEIKKSAEFRIKASNCFNAIAETRCVACDPWPGATLPDKMPTEIFFRIGANGVSHRVSCFDFAGETFLTEFDKMCDEKKMTEVERENHLAKKSTKQVIGELFEKEIENAKVVLIVVSCKDIIDFPDLLNYDPSSAKRIQFAYTLMVDKAIELQHKHKEVKVCFVITQCDQHKALLSADKVLFEKGLKLLVAGSRDEIERIYTSSAYQTELKKIVNAADKSENLKFCPMSDRDMDKGQPSSLGIRTLLECICDVAARVKAAKKANAEEEDRIIKESWMKIKGKLDGLERRASCAIDEAKRIIGKKRAEFNLSPHVRRVEIALESYHKVMSNANDKGYYTTPSKEAVKALEGIHAEVKNDIESSVRILDSALRAQR